MHRVGVVAVWMALGLGSGHSGSADDVLWERQEPDHRLLFTGFDLWRDGGFLYGGFIWSPLGLDRSGFLAKVVSGAGYYYYRSAGTRFVAVHDMTAVMPGMRFRSPRLEVSVYGGLDTQVHVMVPDDPDHPLRGLRFGFRGGVDLWHEPTPSSMLAASLSFASIGPSAWTRVAVGWKAAEGFYMGPELIAAADTDYRQVRLGVHATAVKFGPYEWSIGAGWAGNTDEVRGIYGRFDFLTRR
jgi:hypothetical protein